jgi:16S rRNA (adenine1518-N6/adenine1519-N6)-dimethyltransferase
MRYPIYQSIAELKSLLGKVGVQPNTLRGQHFLVDSGVLRSVADAAQIGSGDVVVEVGAGPGTLTPYLLERASRVIALEVDEVYVQLLRERFSGASSLAIVHQDVLDSGALAGTSSYKVVGNIPYYLTSRLVRHFTELARVKPQSITIMIQEEVARRMVATPPDMNVLAVVVQLFGEPRMVRKVSRGLFFPPPKVESAVVHIDVFGEMPFGLTEQEVVRLLRLVRAAFSQRRKQLGNSLSGLLGDEVTRALTSAQIDLTRRAQTLSIEEWVSLTRVVSDDKMNT